MPLSFIWRLIGDSLMWAAEETKGIEAYNNALFYNPNNISALLGKANIMLRPFKKSFKNYEEANELCNKVLQLDSNNYSALRLN